MYDPYALFEHRVLDNGLNVYCLMEERPFAVLEVIVHAGSREDYPGKEGTAHFVEHLVSRNIPGYPSYNENKTFFRKTGGSVAFGETDYLYTRYKFKLPLESLLDGLKIFGNMLIRAKLESQVEEQRSVIIREYNQAFPTKVAVISNFFGKRDFFPKHRMSHSTPIGTPESVNGISQADLQEFFDRYYCPKNMTIVCAGGVPIEELEVLLGKTSFSDPKPGCRNATVLKIESPVTPEFALQKKSFSEFIKEVPELSAIKRAIAIPEDAAESEVNVLTSMLQDYLYREIREKKALAYEIDVSLRYQNGIRHFFIAILTKPDGAETAGSLISECLGKFDLLENEFRSKLQSKINSINMRDQTIGGIASSASEDIIYYGRIKTLKEEESELRAITWDGLKRIAAAMTDPSRNVSLLIVP